MELNQVTNHNPSTLAIQGWASPTSFACKGWLKNNFKYTLKKTNKESSPRDSLELVTMKEISAREIKVKK